MTIVDKIVGSLGNKDERVAANEHASKLHSQSSGPEALADGKPSEHIVDDRIGGTHTRTVKDPVTHDNVAKHAHHEVTPVVDRTREQVDVHQKVQPVHDSREVHTHHKHSAPDVHRERHENIGEDVASKYQQQGHHTHHQTFGDQTHSTSVNAPKVHEHVNRHIVEEVQPVIERHTQETEHHHTTQRIHESITHAPKVHDTVVNDPIHISEFTGKSGANSALGGSHTARDAITDERQAASSGHEGLSGERRL